MLVSPKSPWALCALISFKVLADISISTPFVKPALPSSSIKPTARGETKNALTGPTSDVFEKRTVRGATPNEEWKKSNNETTIATQISAGQLNATLQDKFRAYLTAGTNFVGLSLVMLPHIFQSSEPLIDGIPASAKWKKKFLESIAEIKSKPGGVKYVVAQAITDLDGYTSLGNKILGLAIIPDVAFVGIPLGVHEGQPSIIAGNILRFFTSVLARTTGNHNLNALAGSINFAVINVGLGQVFRKEAGQDYDSYDMDPLKKVFNPDSKMTIPQSLGQVAKEARSITRHVISDQTKAIGNAMRILSKPDGWKDLLDLDDPKQSGNRSDVSALMLFTAFGMKAGETALSAASTAPAAKKTALSETLGRTSEFLRGGAAVTALAASLLNDWGLVLIGKDLIKNHKPIQGGGVIAGSMGDASLFALTMLLPAGHPLQAWSNYGMIFSEALVSAYYGSRTLDPETKTKRDHVDSSEAEESLSLINFCQEKIKSLLAPN